MFVIVCEFRPQRQHRATTSPLITFQIHLPTLTVDQPYNFVINLEPPTPSYLFWIGIVFTMFPRVHADQIMGVLVRLWPWSPLPSSSSFYPSQPPSQLSCCLMSAGLSGLLSTFLERDVCMCMLHCYMRCTPNWLFHQSHGGEGKYDREQIDRHSLDFVFHRGVHPVLHGARLFLQAQIHKYK